MSALDEKEQKHVRTAMRYLRGRAGTWAAVAQALSLSPVTIDKVMNGHRSVTPSTAFRVARLLGVMVDDLLVGRFLPPGACPNCGHVVTPDFKDEGTVVEDAPRPTPVGGLKLVR